MGKQISMRRYLELPVPYDVAKPDPLPFPPLLTALSQASAASHGQITVTSMGASEHLWCGI